MYLAQENAFVEDEKEYSTNKITTTPNLWNISKQWQDQKDARYRATQIDIMQLRGIRKYLMKDRFLVGDCGRPIFRDFKRFGPQRAESEGQAGCTSRQASQ